MISYFTESKLFPVIYCEGMYVKRIKHLHWNAESHHKYMWRTQVN